MRGMPEFRRHPGMRQPLQPGRPDGSRGFTSVPWLHEGRSRRGSGPAGTHGRERFGFGVTGVPCLPWARTLPGGAMPSPRMQRAAFSSAFLPGASPEAPQGAASSRSPLRALPSAPCRRPAGKGLGAPFRGAGKAAAFSRCALSPRRASVVTSAQRTVKRSERASDDAETCNRRSAESVDTQRRKKVSGRPPGVEWSGAKWCRCSTAGFSSEDPLRTDDLCQQVESRDGGLLFGAGGMLYFRAL